MNFFNWEPTWISSMEKEGLRRQLFLSCGDRIRETRSTVVCMEIGLCIGQRIEEICRKNVANTNPLCCVNSVIAYILECFVGSHFKIQQNKTLATSPQLMMPVCSSTKLIKISFTKFILYYDCT